MLYIITAICMALILPFLSFLNRKAYKDSLELEGVFAMPKIYLFMGYLMIFISLGILIVPQLMSNPPEYYHLIVWGMIVTIFLFGLYIIQLFRMHKITTHKNGFRIHSTFGRKIDFQYKDIESADISTATYFITLKDKKGQTGKFYFHLKGVLTLLNQVQSKSGTDIAKLEKLLKI